MRNYDFHELMSDKEFQKFAASLLEIKEQRQIRSNAFTKDEGIDIYDLNNEIIGQVKN